MDVGIQDCVARQTLEKSKEEWYEEVKPKLQLNCKKYVEVFKIKVGDLDSAKGGC